MPRNTPRPRPARHAYLTLALAAALTATLAGCEASAAAESTAHTPTGRPSTATAQKDRKDQKSQKGQKDQLAALAQKDVDAGAPGVVVRVDKGDGRVIEIARQASWTRADHILTANDQFRMGSNTKTTVATVVLQLVAEHRLKLSDPVEKWLPGLVPDGTAITLRMLLNHTSGLFNYTTDPAVLKAFTGQDTRVWTPRELLAAAVRHDPLFAPGTSYAYSNTNYTALGLIAEKVTGHALDDLVQERIARPLKLKDTYLVTGFGKPNNPRLAHGYEPDASRVGPLLPPYAAAGTVFAGPERSAGHVDTTWVNASTLWAAGGMVSTAQDWARFSGALNSGKLLPPALLKEMRTTVAEESEFPNRRYGLGLEEVSTPCGTVWGHNGQAPGYSSEDYTDATGRRTVSVFTTTIFGLASPKNGPANPAGPANQALVNAAVCTMLGKPIPTTPASPPAGS
ncbi:beta-lactamase family protein [Streptomyces sp. NBC_00414]|uniref:serine hydrolase domain-containing protein n=1 Tax=Streptomyces sp. NBC_00414 TaxID=2975739 RepID=UPI002E1DFE57